MRLEEFDEVNSERSRDAEGLHDDGGDYYPPPGISHRLAIHLEGVSSLWYAVLLDLLVYTLIGLIIGTISYLLTMGAHREGSLDFWDTLIVDSCGFCSSIFLMPGFVLVVYQVHRRMVKLKQWKQTVSALVSVPVGLNIVFILTMRFSNSASTAIGYGTIEYAEATQGEMGQFCLLWMILSLVLALIMSRKTQLKNVPFARVVKRDHE